jgi:hypothetical protein
LDTGIGKDTGVAKAKTPASGTKSTASAKSDQTEDGKTEAKSSGKDAQTTGGRAPAKTKSDAADKSAKPAPKTDAESAKPGDDKKADEKPKAAETTGAKDDKATPKQGAKDPAPSAASAAASGAASKSKGTTDPKPKSDEKTSSASPSGPKSATPASPPADAKKPSDASSTASAATPKSTSTAQKPEGTPTSAPQRQRSIFLPLVLGGLVAGGLGYIAGENDLLPLSDRESTLEARLSDQESAIEALQNAEAPIPEAPDLSAVEGSLESLRSDLSALSERLSELESRPRSTPTEGEAPLPSDLAADLEEMRQAVEAQSAEVSAQQQEIADLIANARDAEAATAEAAREAAAREALAGIRAALGSGSAFAEEIAALEEAGLSDLPEGILAPAESGAVTLSSLQTRFPEVAREALAAARAEAPAEEEAGIGAFLRRQLGARSVTPREGSSPDAILSRAEDLLRNGALSEALSELEALPESASEAMAGWLSEARTLADARAAAETLSQRLSAN